MFPLVRSRNTLAAMLALVLVVLAAPPARTQSMDSTDSLATSALPETPRHAETDSLLVLIPLRAVEEIQRELAVAHERRSAAETRTARARVLQGRARAELDVNRAQLDAISSRIKLAKQDQDATRKAEFERQRKFAQLERRLLERRETLRQQEIDLASADHELAEATSRARDAELALALKRDQHAETASRPGSNTVELQTVERELQSLERRALRAQIDEGTQRQSYARRESDLARARLLVFEAQFKVGQGGGSSR